MEDQDYTKEEIKKYPNLSSYFEREHEKYFDEYEIEQIVGLALKETAKNQNEGYFPDRLEHNEREKAFHDQWKKENATGAGINHGHGILQDLFFKIEGNRIMSKTILLEEINKRDRKIVATVIQWLGSNCGISFLHEALRNCGYRLVYDKELHEKNKKK